MTTYLEKTLATGEEVLLETRISLLSFLGNFIVGGATLLWFAVTIGISNRSAFAALLVGVVVLLHPILRYMTSELALTNRRVVAKFGVLSTESQEIRLDKIESVGVHQSLIGRLFGYGSIVVSGTGGSRDVLPDIPDPITFRTKFAAALEHLGKN